MPGSLLFSNDAYSDLSESSVKSLDSKIGAKKVSFNRAVRVKQYPWKPDLDYNSAEHLTLPSNRFWFKVHKNKHETQDFISPAEDAFKSNTWNEDDIENIHDSLAPIAEVEDLDIDSNNMKSKTTMKDICYGAKYQKNTLNSVNDFNNFNHPVEPPPDYLDDVKFVSNRNYYKGNETILESNKTDEKTYDNNNNVFNKDRINHSPYGLRILEESDENEENRFTDPAANRLPRMITRDSSPFRHSIRNFDTSDFLKNRERRSRSYDDHLDRDKGFQLRKADKSVSTDDLNSNHGSSCFTNSFLRGSRDMATQCYGTLTRNQNVASFDSLNSSKKTSEEDRLNNFKSSSTFRKSFGVGNASTTSKVLQLKKDSQEKDSSKTSRPYDYHTQNNLLSNEKILNYKKHDQSFNSKLSDDINKLLNRSYSVRYREQNQNGSPYKAPIKIPGFQSKPPLKGGPKNLRENNKIKTIDDSISLGYLRGRQIPLSEMNTNTNCNIKNNKNENSFVRNLYRTESKTPSPYRATKPDSALTSALRPKKDSSSNQENRKHKNGSNSAKSYPAGSEMIDWSLSGFQLGPKPDNGISSMSDSEYTVHRRPPLLMYIPGVSHHDRPAIEDDRLSHLSDLSRSEYNEGSGDLRRQYSMPRDGKLKWIKWRNKEKFAKKT